MAEAKLFLKYLNNIFFVLYGVNLMTLLIESANDYSSLLDGSTSTREIFAVFGIVFLFFKIVNYCLEMYHKFKMNKLDRRNKELEIEFKEEMKSIKESRSSKKKKKKKSEVK